MNRLAAQEISDRIRLVAGRAGALHLHEPEIGEVEKEMVLACLESGQISGSGAFYRHV